MQTKQIILLAVFSVLAIGAGIGVGFLGNKLTSSPTEISSEESADQVISQVATDVASIKNGDVFGSQDADTFNDSAQGYLVAGGIDGEGSHRLERMGGISQTVYLTSSVTDLDKFVGMDVKVWGETNKGQKAGWLMDVGRVQIVNIQGTQPEE
jgi:hypothetical protein